MGREGICIEQPASEPVDVANWRPDEEFAVYMEAMRASITSMESFQVPVPLTAARAGLVCRLIEARYQALMSALTE